MADDVRWDKVRRVRREIAEGRYVTEEKLRFTMAEMLKDIAERPESTPIMAPFIPLYRTERDDA